MAKNKKQKFLPTKKKYSSSQKRKINRKSISCGGRKKQNNIKIQSLYKNKDGTFYRINKNYNNNIRINKKEKEKKNKDYTNKLSMTFYDALKTFYWDLKTQKTVTSIFNQYQEFINQNFPNIKSKGLDENKNLENDPFFQENNIVKFLRSYKNFKTSTYNNRLGLFRRIIKIMTYNPFWDYINVSVQEKKTKNEKLFSITQKHFLLNKINKNECFDMLILFELVFDLGFTIYQCSRIKIKNIYFNQELIELKYKGKRKVRGIGCELSNMLEKYIKKKGLNDNNYLLFNRYVETKSMNRNKFLYHQLSKLILNCEELNTNVKEELLIQMNKERIISNKISDELNLKNNFENPELLNNENFQCLKSYDNYNDNISILEQKSYDSFYNINNDSLTPKIENNFELFVENNNFSQKKFVLLTQEINLEIETIKNALLEKLKNLDIKFIDNPIKELSFIGLNTFTDKAYTPTILSDDNLKLYKNLKIYSSNGYYNGLILSKLEENIFVIEATKDINENTLLFEIGGEVVSRDYLIKYKKDLISKNLCYFKYCEGIENSKFFLLLRNYGNIAFFLQNTDQYEPNVEIKDFINNEDGTIILLCYAIKKILTGQILMVKDKYINLNL